MTKNTPSPQQPLILWVVLFASLAMYGIIGSVIDIKASMPADTLQFMLIAFGVVALSNSMLIFTVVPKMMTSRPKTAQTYLVFGILRWAMSEVVAILGLVYKFMGGQATFFYAFLGWAVLLMLFTMPSKRDQEAFGVK